MLLQARWAKFAICLPLIAVFIWSLNITVTRYVTDSYFTGQYQFLSMVYCIFDINPLYAENRLAAKTADQAALAAIGCAECFWHGVISRFGLYRCALYDGYSIWASSMPLSLFLRLPLHFSYLKMCPTAMPS